MENLINKYKYYNKQFWCWWVTDILTVILGFAAILNVSIIAIVFQLALTVLSIVFLVITGAKKTQVVKNMISVLSRDYHDGEAIINYLVQNGVSRRDVLPYVTLKRYVEHKETPIKVSVNNSCPNCGSTNITEARSPLDEFFWLIVIMSALGYTISSFVMFLFGVCCILSIIIFIINRLSGNKTKKMVCKYCKKEFEI